MSVLETPFELVVVGPGIDATFPLSRQVMTIGRSRAAMPDIEIGDADAAPRHCIVLWNESAGCHALRVFGVTGVCLKGTVVAGDGALHRLSIGDTFRIGATTFTYRAAQPSAAAGQVDDLEATRDPPTVLAAPTSREVYEFEVLPRLAGDGFDWTRPLVNHGPRRRIEAPMQAVRVVVTRGAPRAAVAAALKHIADLVDAPGAVDERTPAPLVTLSKWFDGSSG